MSAGRYRFGEPGARGLLGQIRPGQVIVAALGAGWAIAMVDLSPSGGGAAAAVLGLLAAAMIATLPVAGLTLEQWAPIALGWLVAVVGGRARWSRQAPADGTVVELPSSGVSAAGVLRRSRPSPPRELAGVRIIEVPYRGRMIGAVVERGGRRLTLALLGRAPGFALADESEQQQRLAVWGEALKGASRSAVRRIGWVERTAPAQRDGLARWLYEQRDPEVPPHGLLGRSYLELMDKSGQATCEHEVIVTVQIDAGLLRQDVRGRREQALISAAERIAQTLERARVTIDTALSAGGVARALRVGFDPYAHPQLAALRAGSGSDELSEQAAWPAATRAHWGHYQSDGAVHATFEIGGWPRSEVGPAFLGPLLGPSDHVRAVAVCFEPLDPLRSLRQAEYEITREETDRQTRRRFGQVETARQRQASDVARMREAELASGHSEVRLAGFVTVTGRDLEELEAACEDVITQAGRANLELRRLYGRQAPGVHVHAAAVPGAQMRVERAGIRASTRHARAIYPFQTEAGLGWRGCLIGSDSSGGAFCFDPWELYRRELVANPNVAVFGELGYGKSSLMKTLLWRMLVFGRRAFVLDVKGEYAPLCEAVGVKPIRLAPGAGVRLNPLSARGERSSQIEILRAVARTAVGRALFPEEAAALREALVEVCERGELEPTLPRVLEVLFAPSAAVAAALRSSTAEVADAVREVALGLQDLCEGPLRGMFDGPTTPGVAVDGRLVVLDLEAVKDSPAIGILMACASGWLSARLQRLADRRDPGRLISVADEVWKVLEHEGLAQWFRANFKLTRKYGTLNVIVAHKPADVIGSGDEGTARHAAARGLITDCATRVIYRQAAGDIPICVSTLGLSDREAEIVCQLHKGQALWQVGARSFVVQHYRSTLERALTDNDAGMSADRLGFEEIMRSTG